MLGEPGQYSTACMFTEAETQLLYDEQKKKLGSCGSDISFTFSDLRKWFNGYNSGDGQRLYNPWSIARAFGANKLGSYWTESGYDRVILTRIQQMLKSDDKFRKQIEGLLMDEPVTIELDQGMTYSSFTEMSMRQLWTLLYSAGYLTTRMIDETQDAGSDVDSSSGSVSSSDDGDSETSNGEDSSRDSDSGEDSDGSDSSGGEDNDGSDSSNGDLKAAISAQIPNYEIRSLFRQWLLDHFMDRMKRSSRTTNCVDMFQHMVSGSMALFAKGFSKFVWQTMPTQFLGSKECVYQAYVSAFLTVASQLASPDQGFWEVKVECNGIGRLDLIFSRNDKAAIQEHKRVVLSAQDKKSGYGDSQRKRLTRAAEKGLRQIEVKGYRARLPDTVTELREFGIAFLGPYCAIESHSLKRKPGGQWKFKKTYMAERNERHRDQLYTAYT